MTFSSIIFKNLKHNLKKYISFFFVNSFIVAVLFMYGSLMFNNIIIKEIGKSVIFENMKMAFIGIVSFSIIFISYTNISFVKYRGKEFGVYLTLGMTTKDLRKMTLLENIAIMIASLFTGIITGLVFSRLFYMIVSKILMMEKLIYELSYKTFLLSSGVFLVIFIINTIFTNIYIYKLSIIEVIKSSSKKEIEKSRLTLGTLALIIFVLSLYFLPKTLLNQSFNGNDNMIIFFAIVTIICPYFIIGIFITLFKNVVKLFPKLYNNNLLVLANLSHRFSAYKTVLYIVSLLVSGAIFFIGFTYNLYSSAEEQINESHPYEIMFVEENKYNHISTEEVEQLIKINGGKVEKYSVLEYIRLPQYMVVDGKVEFYDDKSSVISESNYNKHMNTKIDVKSGELVQVNVIKERTANSYKNSYVIFTFEDEKKVKERSKIFDNEFKVSKEKFFNTVDKDNLLVVSKDKKTYINASYTNYHVTNMYYTGSAFIVDDNDYARIKNKMGDSSISKNHLINLKKGDKSKIFYALVSDLQKVNKGNEKSIIEDYKPVFKEEILKASLKENGSYFFSMMFLGLIFLISSGVVLYYKVLTDIEEERQRIESISKIGMTSRELQNILLGELRTIFFVPIILGGGLGLYYLSIMFSNSSLMYLLVKKSIILVLIYAVLQTIFYFICRRRYLNEVLR
jgi:ABC-type antimicrobial peptide transport system permease subunit